MTLQSVQPDPSREDACRGPWSGRLCRNSRPGATGEAQYGAAGVAFFAPPETRIALFELTSAMTYPDLEGAGTSHLTVESTPYATARQLWCHQFDPDDKTPGGDPLRSYGGTTHSKDETIYHPGVFRNANGYAIGHPALRAGDRVFCAWDRQSGRWEVLAPPLGVWRFELKTALAPGSHATAYLLGYCGGYEEDVRVEFEVYDALDGTLRGRAKTEALSGSQGYAKYMPDSGRWEILAMAHQARWIRFSLAADMPYNSSTGTGEVLSYWDGYDPDPNHQYVTLVNCAVRGVNQYLFAGTAGACGLACYKPEGDKYHIVQLECP